MVVGGLEGHVLVSRRCLVLGAFRRYLMTILVALGIEELDPVDVDEVPVVLGARLLVVPRFRTFAAFEVDAGTFVKMFAGDLCPAAEGLYGKPLRVFLQFAVLVLPSFGGGDGELRDGRSLLAVLHLGITAKISNQHNLLHTDVT